MLQGNVQAGCSFQPALSGLIRVFLGIDGLGMLLLHVLAEPADRQAETPQHLASHGQWVSACQRAGARAKGCTPHTQTLKFLSLSLTLSREALSLSLSFSLSLSLSLSPRSLALDPPSRISWGRTPPPLLVPPSPLQTYLQSRPLAVSPGPSSPLE